MVRILLGAPNRIHPEPHLADAGKFIEKLLFEQRSKLEELPELRESDRDVFFDITSSSDTN